MYLFAFQLNLIQKRFNRFGFAFFCLCAGLFLTSTTYAAAPNPNNPELNTYGGQILQQIERDLNVKPSETLPSIEMAPETAVEDQGPKVTVKQFTFVGNKVVSSAQLESILEPFLPS